MDELVLGFAAFLGVTSLVMLVGVLARRRQPQGGRPHLANQRPAISASIIDDEHNTKLRRLGDRLIQAGLYKRNSVGMYAASKAALCIIPIIGWLLAAQAGFISFQSGIIYGLATFILGILVPSVWLDLRKKKRQTLLRRALPDAVDVIVICVEAGLSLPAALKRVSSELKTAHRMLASELTIVQREIQMGCSTGEGLKRFADRFDLEELRSMAAVIEQAERYGASIVTALRVHADSLRVRRFQQAEERAQQASVKLLIPTIIFIFPALFVVLLGPAAMDIMKMLNNMNERLGGL